MEPRGAMVISFSCLASRRPKWSLALLFILVMMTRVHGQSTSEFVSIDCGNSTTYNDITTGIQYHSDAGYVEGGLSHKISAEFMDGAGNDQQITLRSFPDGSRNCYTLPSVTNKKFLLRAIFSYGNYDGLNRSMDGSLFLFGLHIGVNFWDTVNLTNTDPSISFWKEVLTVAPGDSVSVCLMNFGSGTPFVSSLELRPLLDAMYPFVNTSVSVGYFRRIRFGEATEYITRYPVDPYDRFWEGWSFSYKTYPWIALNTSSQVEILPGDDYFNVPMAIFQTATTLDTNYSFIVINASVGPNVVPESVRLLPIFHFAEISGNNMQRSFDIYNAGDVLHRGFSPSRLQASSLYNSGQFLYNGDAVYTLKKTRGSSLPPLINAFEVYSLLRMENFTTDSEDVNYMKQVKAHYNLTRIDWNGDSCSPREYTWEGLTCGYSSSNKNPRIVQVNLSSSGLGGGLAISLLNMTSLENLDLSHNNLVGTIPDCQIKSLAVLNLANNKLEGPIPSYILRRFQAGLLDLRFGNSGDHEDYATYEEETPIDIDIRRFTYAELKLITKDFQSIIGKGGFGIVYHGILENGDEVAVKVLMETSISKSTDFLPEVQTLSKVHHKNLVTLEGYCQNKKCLALVYDFMPRGNLQQLLRGGDDHSLNWEQRLHIALDAAQGLEYLHESCTPAIVHRDVKTPNILLDKNLVGIISDFGLSRAFHEAHTHISTVAAGTLGYLDPEYHATFQLTVKADVYSFGVVLLEIITGQPPVLVDPQTIHLTNWTRQKIATGSIHEVVDKRLLDQYDASSLKSVVDLAMNCVENAAIDRPTMTEVVSRLKMCLPAVPRSLKFMISGIPTISSDGNSQSSHAGRMSETSLLSGR